MNQPNRRQFLLNAGKALGGLALVNATSRWAFATKNPVSDLIHRSSWAMGTSIRVSMPQDIFTSNLADSSFKSLQRVDSLLSAHNEQSALMRMNASAGVWSNGRELVDVSRAAHLIGEQTSGALDVTVLPAMRRFGFIPGKVSDVDRIDYAKLEVRGDAARISESGFGADFGGIAKGYGVDEAIAALRTGGVQTALVDAGGDLFALGRPDADRLWKIGIRHPELENQLVATLELENEAVATSGIYEQKHVVNGIEISHLIDPKTGTPVNHVVSATIIAGNTMMADGLATATSILQPKAAQALIESMHGVEGFWIYSDGTHYITHGLRTRLHLV